MNERRDLSKISETNAGDVEHPHAGDVEHADKSYVTDTRGTFYLEVPDAAAEEPALPREAGLFAEVPSWDPPAADKPPSAPTTEE